MDAAISGKRTYQMTNPSPHNAIARVKDLPTLPAVLGRILETAFDPDASALELARHVAADQALSARLLKIVNSPYYGYYRQISSLTTAVVILGFAEIRNIVFTATAFRTIQETHSGYDRTGLWRHSLATAIAAERCAYLLNFPKDSAFVAGLLHDIGKVALDSIYPDRFAQTAAAAREAGRPLLEAEREAFGVDHAEAGGVLAEHWNLPEEVAEAIRLHHAPEEQTSNPTLTRLTALSNFLAYEAGFGDPANVAAPETPTASVHALGLDEQRWMTVADQVRDREAQIDAILGAVSN